MREQLAEAAAKADKAEQALEHLRPAFDTVRALYSERLQEVAVKEPWAADKLRALALAQKIAQAVQEQIEAIAIGGEYAEEQMARLRQIEKMSPERRRILGL